MYGENGSFFGCTPSTNFGNLNFRIALKNAGRGGSEGRRGLRGVEGGRFFPLASKKIVNRTLELMLVLTRRKLLFTDYFRHSFRPSITFNHSLHSRSLPTIYLIILSNVPLNSFINFQSFSPYSYNSTSKIQQNHFEQSNRSTHLPQHRLLQFSIQHIFITPGH